MHVLAEATVPDVAPSLNKSTKRSDFKPDWRYSGGMLQVIEHKAVLNLLDRLFNISWSSMGSSGLFQELSKVFALKILDEKNTEVGQPYRVQRKKGETDDDLYARLNQFYEESLGGILSDNHIEMRPFGFGQVIDKIAPINLSVSCPDILGLAYGAYISGHSRSTLGQFFTPAQVCDFVVQLLDPEPGAKILDPACGSGSFLASAHDYMTRGGRFI